MTKKHAALLSYIMWSWLERNPGRRKQHHPLYYELNYHKLFNSCPWCEIYFADDKNCGDCHLNKNNDNCAHKNSNYLIWSRHVYYNYVDKKRAQIAAGEISKTAWKEYKRLGG